MFIKKRKTKQGEDDDIAVFIEYKLLTILFAVVEKKTKKNVSNNS
jgi:hypothetical protein